MDHNFHESLDFVLRPENDGQHFHVTPGDQGGATNEGIIWTTFVWWEQAHGNHAPTLVQFRDMPMSKIAEIYHVAFWNATRCPELPPGLDMFIFNLACAGPGTAVRCLQRALGVRDDGIFSKITMRAVSVADPVVLLPKVAGEARAWFSSRPTAHLFLHGWLRRLGDAQRMAAEMAKS